MAEGAPLLREYGLKAHRGFESLSLRQNQIGKREEMANIALLAERLCGLFFRSARSHSKTARKATLGPVSFAGMVLAWQRHIFSGIRERWRLSRLAERLCGLFFRSARSHSKTARKAALGPVSFASMVLAWQRHIFSEIRERWRLSRLAERLCGLFFRSARSHSKTARKAALGPVSFASMVLAWQRHTFSGIRERWRLSRLAGRLCGLFFRSARSHSKTARKAALDPVSFISMILRRQCNNNYF